MSLRRLIESRSARYDLAIVSWTILLFVLFVVLNPPLFFVLAVLILEVVLLAAKRYIIKPIKKTPYLLWDDVSLWMAGRKSVYLNVHSFNFPEKAKETTE